MPNRTFGWIQNPGNLNTLKEVVGVFLKNSDSYLNLLNYKLPLIKKNAFITDEDYANIVNVLTLGTDIVVPYNIAKGRGAGKLGRAKALCSGLVQAVISAQKTITMIGLNDVSFSDNKPYTDDWTADGYLRWAVSTGLLDYNAQNDTCTISSIGKKLVRTADNSKEEQDVFEQVLLSYPPVYRILTLLSDHKLHTKFEMGQKLGFKGELGFTSIPQNVFVYDFCSAGTSKARTTIRSNMEGDADKYARMIANWICKLGWADTKTKEVTETYFGSTHKMNLQAWHITREGERAIIRSDGNSSNRRISKIVKYEMLASKISDCDYVRFRRANILNSLKTERSLSSIQKYLKDFLLEESLATIQDDITNFENIGLRIVCKNDKFKLLDDIIGLEIPYNTAKLGKSSLTMLKDKIRSQLHNIDHKYLVLVDLAYSNASSRVQKNLDAKEFEIETANLLSSEIGFRAERLGDSNKPDVLMEYDKFGTIIDNKSYKDGLSISAGLRDEMARYVEENDVRQPNIPPNEWWKWFSNSTEEYTFLYVTSFLKGNFSSQIKYISDLRNVKGAAISIENLLYFAEALKSGAMEKKIFFSQFNNDEIVFR